MKMVDIYNILSIRESYTRCKLPDKYYLECATDRKLYLCYGYMDKGSIYSIELQKFGYDKLIAEIKNTVKVIEKWRLSDIQKSIDNLAELGLYSYPNNSPRLCK